MNVIYLNDKKLKDLSNKMAEFSVEKPYLIKFFVDKPPSTVVFVSSKEKNLEQLLSFLIKDDKIIVLGLKWNQQNTSIDLFQIATSKGVILIQNKGPSPELNQFLTSHTFYMKGVGYNIQNITKYLNSNNFSYIDIETEYLIPKEYPLDFLEIVRKFGGKITAHFNSPEIYSSDWSGKLNLQQICYAAFNVIGLRKAIPKIKNPNPSPKPKPTPPFPSPKPKPTPPFPSPKPKPNDQSLEQIILEQQKIIDELNDKLELVFKELDQINDRINQMHFAPPDPEHYKTPDPNNLEDIKQNYENDQISSSRLENKQTPEKKDSVPDKNKNTSNDKKSSESRGSSGENHNKISVPEPQPENKQTPEKKDSVPDEKKNHPNETLSTTYDEVMVHKQQKPGDMNTFIDITKKCCSRNFIIMRMNNMGIHPDVTKALIMAGRDMEEAARIYQANGILERVKGLIDPSW